jgi:integrase
VSINYLTEDDVFLFIKDLSNHDRDLAAQVGFALHSGFTLEETCRIKLGHINFSDSTVLRMNRKTGEYEKWKMNGRVLGLLHQCRPATPYFFFKYRTVSGISSSINYYSRYLKISASIPQLRRALLVKANNGEKV